VLKNPDLRLFKIPLPSHLNIRRLFQSAHWGFAPRRALAARDVTKELAYFCARNLLA
jgi:hypothetical protein